MRPRPCVAMKLIDSAVTHSAAMQRSPSFSRSSSSTRTIILPPRMSESASLTRARSSGSRFGAGGIFGGARRSGGGGLRKGTRASGAETGTPDELQGCTRLRVMTLGRPVRLAILACVLVACGPSFQVVYEGDSRFEHCYALDENPNVSMQQKSDCWSDWMKHYTYGQTRDRVEFAAMRFRAIQRADTLPTDEAVMGAAPGEGTNGTI